MTWPHFLLSYMIDTSAVYRTATGQRPILGVRIGLRETKELADLASELGCSKSKLARSMICFCLLSRDALFKLDLSSEYRLQQLPVDDLKRTETSSALSNGVQK